MREYALRTGSSPEERGERQKSKAKPASGNRSKRSVNLGRLAAELGMDVFGAALGLSDQAVQILVDGRDHAREEQYSVHLIHKLEDAGIPMVWLERPFAPIQPEYLHWLKVMASESRNKNPIRRYNFSRLAKAFDGRLDVLGDALEMINSSVSNVAEGRLDLDDHRFGHINPRLMKAGFPDGWLEQADPELTDAMLEGLEQLATDEYEQALDDVDEVESTMGQAFVSPPPAQAAVEVKASATEEPTKEPLMAKPTPQAPTPAAEQKPTQPSLPTFATPQFKAAGLPGATPTMAHPGVKLPRSVMAAGRKVATPAAPNTKRGAKPASMPPAAAASVAEPQLAMPQVAESAQQTLSLKPKKGAAAPAPVAAAPAPVAPAAAPAPSMNRLGSVSTEVSLARAEALEKLFESCPRGVKGLLWKNILGFQLPAWGNIRRGHAKFRNTLADAVEEAMGLPNGWLDAPSYPPSSLAAWVTTPGSALPPCPAVLAVEKTGRAAPAAAVAAPAPAVEAPAPAPVAAPAAKPTTKPFARKTPLVPPKVTMTTPPTSKPSLKGKEAPAPVAAAPAAAPIAPADPVAPVAPAAVVAPEVVAPVSSPEPAVAAPAPVATPASVAVPVPVAQAAAAGMTWASPQGQPGPICQALMAVMATKSAAGVFSEQDALAMLNTLMSK